MFPINDVNGSPVAFTARVSPEREATEMMGKYINSPEGMLYSKSKTVFGLDKAKMAIKEAGYCIVVEGQMDCISCHQAGWKNVVASSGTAFTPEQLKLIKRYSGNIAFSFDMDEAGQLAADRAIRGAMSAEMNIKVITIDGGKDPDELIRNNPEAWRESVKNSKHVMEYFFDKTFSALDVSTPEGKRGAAKKILPMLGCLRDKIEQDYWLKKLAQILDIGEVYLRETLVSAMAKEKKITEKISDSPAEPAAEQSKEERASENFLAMIFHWPIFFPYVADKVPVDLIFGRGNKMFYNNLIIYYNEKASGQKVNSAENWLDYSSFKTWLNNLGGLPEADCQDKLLDKIVVLGEKDYFSLDSAQAKNELIKIISFLRKEYYQKIFHQKEKEIAAAERNGDSFSANRALEELKTLKEEARMVFSNSEE
jgi:DNA primase